MSPSSSSPNFFKSSGVASRCRGFENLKFFSCEISASFLFGSKNLFDLLLEVGFVGLRLDMVDSFFLPNDSGEAGSGVRPVTL